MENRILLVDDNAEFLDSTKDVLEDAGYDVLTAANGEEAISIFKKKKLHTVLMDIIMPGINGVETFLKMKEMNSGTNVILMTAFSMSDIIDKARREGICDILSKPLDMARLLKIIEKNNKINNANIYTGN